MARAIPAVRTLAIIAAAGLTLTACGKSDSKSASINNGTTSSRVGHGLIAVVHGFHDSATIGLPEITEHGAPEASAPATPAPDAPAAETPAAFAPLVL